MRGVLRPALWAVAGAAALGVAACNNSAQTISPDEKAIRDLDAKAMTLINSKDVSGVAALYTDNGGVYPPNAPPAIGSEAVMATFTALTQAPGFQLDFQPNKITISASKDMAIETGTYTVKTGDVNAPQVERGKYVTGWLKQNNAWKMYTDMFSPDTAPAPQASSMPAAAPMTDTLSTPSSMQAPAATTEPTAPAQGAAPAATQAGAPPVQGTAAPVTGEQTTPTAPVQQFGPAPPVQNAAPLAPNNVHVPAQPAEAAPNNSTSAPAPAPQQ